MKYMSPPLAEGEEDSGDSSYGAEETEAAPVLAEALRVDIPRASLRYLFIHHLQLNYRYTKKKTTFSDPVKRHHLNYRYATWAEGGDFQVRGDYVLVLRLTILRTWARRAMLLLSLSDNPSCSSFLHSSAL
jgi:hypothetical protein